MRKLLLLLVLLLSAAGASAQARVFSQPELDALLAPVALYPDTVLSDVLAASTQPHQVAEAAGWSRANPQLSGDAAVEAARQYGWHPAVAALTAFPDLLARMAESPQWVADLGTAYTAQEPLVMDTVQQLRLRAQAAGTLQSDAQQQVYSDAGRVVVQPTYSSIVVLPYYNPVVAFGPWWYPAYRPVYWRPWYARPVAYRWAPARLWIPRPHPVRAVPVRVQQAVPVRVQQAVPVRAPAQRAAVREYVRVPEAQRQPIVQSPAVQHRSAMPAASGYSQHRNSAPHGQAHSGRGHRRG